MISQFDQIGLMNIQTLRGFDPADGCDEVYLRDAKGEAISQWGDNDKIKIVGNIEEF